MSKEKFTKILEGTLSFLKRVILFLPALIGLVNPPKKEEDAGSSK